MANHHLDTAQLLSEILNGKTLTAKHREGLRRAAQTLRELEQFKRNVVVQAESLAVLDESDPAYERLATELVGLLGLRICSGS